MVPDDQMHTYQQEGMDEYVLKVDGEEDARGFRGAPDAPECQLILGTPSAPRDEGFNELLPLLDQLRGCGLEVLPLEEQPDEVLFDGDFDRIIWKERQWIKHLDKMEWVSYQLHVDTEDAMVKRVTSKAPRADETVIMTEPEAAPEPFGTATAYAIGDTVEYWSKTTNSWLGARVMDIRGQPFHSEEHGMNVFTYDLFVKAAGQRVPNADMKDLRLPFSVSEKVSVFSKKLGYDIVLEPSELKTDMLEHARQLKAQKELQGNQYEGRPGRGSRRLRNSGDQDVAGSAELDSVPPVAPLGGAAERASSRPPQVPPLPLGQEDGNGSLGISPEDGPMPEEDLPVLKNMPGKRLRRRFDGGMPVQVYLGAEQGFLTGTVVGSAGGPEPRQRGGRAHGAFFETAPALVVRGSRLPSIDHEVMSFWFLVSFGVHGVVESRGDYRHCARELELMLDRVGFSSLDVHGVVESRGHYHQSARALELQQDQYHAKLEVGSDGRALDRKVWRRLPREGALQARCRHVELELDGVNCEQRLRRFLAGLAGLAGKWITDLVWPAEEHDGRMAHCVEEVSDFLATEPVRLQSTMEVKASMAQLTRGQLGPPNTTAKLVTARAQAHVTEAIARAAAKVRGRQEKSGQRVTSLKTRADRAERSIAAADARHPYVDINALGNWDRRLALNASWARSRMPSLTGI
ncbi:unnamed protein product [Prorocentrum cordatum]|uniref:Uncharacterized protein n=1 Tax=Prorocentrum cordatum TaxID=2364126 RepID=A0ABN9XS31_9DINO|nr:unnamed protein product [Polarella glacialis]